jgi:hypothetical protein
MRALSLQRLVGALKDALDTGGAERALMDNLTGAPFGRQRSLPYYEPARGGSPRVRDLVENPAVRTRMLETIERGVEMGADKWYDTKPLLAAFIAELGPAEGPQAFRRFMDFNAAVSPRSQLEPQIRRASFFYGADRRGEGIPWTPDRYGHFAQKVHRGLLEQLRNGGLNIHTAPKTSSYRENLAGNQAPVTVDSHATALPAIFSADPRWLKTGSDPVSFDGEPFTPRNAFQYGEIDVDDALERPSWWGGRPLKSEYAPLTRFYGELGHEAGLTPAQAQSAAWVGGGDITGVQSGPEPYMRHFVDRVRDTAEQRSISFEDALKRMIRGQDPLLALPLLLAALQRALADDASAEA